MIIRAIEELTPRMQKKVVAFLEDCHSQGVMCYPFETYRSQERQDELYAQGRTQPGPIITWTLKSRHTQREAVDMAFGGEGKWTWEGDWDTMREIASKYGLESLYPRENAHLQDDGTDINFDTMEKSARDYKNIYNSNFDDPTLTDWDGDDVMDEGQIKAFVEIYGEKLLRSDKFREFVIDIIKQELTN
jgi:hypothetical protein